METKNLKSIAFWGAGLWLFGYILGILFFAFVPNQFLGWAIMPFGVAVTLWVLARKIKVAKLGEYAWAGIIWALTAVILDYFFLVRVFKPVDGYYKFDVYFYYFVTLALPIVFGLIKNNKIKP